jgi:DNA replication protein DnaC
VQDLLIAKDDLELDRRIKRIRKQEAVIFDDIDYLQHGREEMEVLFTLLAGIYIRRMVMLTSSLPFSQWEQTFEESMTWTTAIDRLLHHSIILELNLPSHQLEESKRRGEERAHQTRLNDTKQEIKMSLMRKKLT